MIKATLLAFLICATTICFGQPKIEIVKIDWYKNILKSNNDTTYIINFWATWCIPCVQEIPEFEKITEQYKDKKVRVILMSLDAIKKINISLMPFLEKKKLKSTVVVLNEPNFNSWIDKVNKNWEGSLPATVVFNNQKRVYHFFENSITFEQIEKLILNK